MVGWGADEAFSIQAPVIQFKWKSPGGPTSGPPIHFHPGHSPEDIPRHYCLELSVNKLLTIDYTASLRSKLGKSYSPSLACHAGKADPILIIIDGIN